MYVESCIIRIKLHHATTLKEKRAIVKSVIEKIRSRYNASVAEVGDMDTWQLAQIGFSLVSNGAEHAAEQREKIIRFVEEDFRFDVLDIQML